MASLCALAPFCDLELFKQAVTIGLSKFLPPSSQRLLLDRDLTASDVMLALDRNQSLEFCKP